MNSFLLQPIINYNLANQWYLTSVPIITANWNAAEGNTWTVPVGGGFGKIFRIGSQAVNGSFQAFLQRRASGAQHPTAHRWPADRIHYRRRLDTQVPAPAALPPIEAKTSGTVDKKAPIRRSTAFNRGDHLAEELAGTA